MSKQKVSISDIVDLMAVRQNLSQKETEEFVKMLLSTVEDVLIDGEPVKIKDFGTFKPHWNEPQEVFDKTTGTNTTIPGFYKVMFEPSTELKELINNTYTELNADTGTKEQTLPLKESPVEQEPIAEKKETATIPPMRVFEEQATEIKNILDEIEAMSGKKETAIPEENTDIDNFLQTQTEIDTRNEILMENSQPENPPTIETDKDDEPFDNTDANTNEKNIANTLQVNENDDDNDRENATSKIEEIPEQSSKTEKEAEKEKITSEKEKYETFKQLKRREKQERKEKRKSEIIHYFKENDFDIVRQVQMRDNITENTPEEELEIDEPTISEIAKIEETDHAAATVGDIENKTKSDATNGQEEIIEETPLCEPAEKEVYPAAENKSISTDDYIQEQHKSQIIYQNTTTNIQDREEESETVVWEAKSGDQYQQELQKKKILEEKVIEDSNINYTFTEVKKKKRSWGWLIFILILILLALVGWKMLPSILSSDRANKQVTEQTTQSPPQLQPSSASAIEAKASGTNAVSADSVETTVNIFDVPRKYNRFIAARTIEQGLQLSRLAQEYYGSPYFWVYIYEANRNTIANPNDIPIGTKINVPALDSRLINIQNPECIRYAKKMADVYLATQ